MTVSPTSGWLDFRCASCAKRAGANSHIHALKQSRLAPAWRCDAPASCDDAGAHFDTAIHGLHRCGLAVWWFRTRELHRRGADDLAHVRLVADVELHFA